MGYKKEIFGYGLHLRIMEPSNGRNVIYMLSSSLIFKGLLCSVLNKGKNCYLVTAGCTVRIMNNGKKNFKEEPLRLFDVGDR